MRVQIFCLTAAALFLHGCASTDGTLQQGCSICSKTPASAYRLLPHEDLPRVRPGWGDLRRANNEGTTVHLCDGCLRMRYERQPQIEERLP